MKTAILCKMFNKIVGGFIIRPFLIIAMFLVVDNVFTDRVLFISAR